MFVDNQQARPPARQISREDPEFAAAVYVDAEVDKSSLRGVVSHHLHARSDARDTAARAAVREPTGGPGLAVRRRRECHAGRTPSERRASKTVNLPSSGETWEIELRKPQGTAFEIRGQRTTRSQTALAVSLATLPAAIAHEGRLTIRSMDGTRLSVKAQAVKPIPIEPPPPGNFPTTRACYRFDASRNARVVIDRVPPRGDGARCGCGTAS